MKAKDIYLKKTPAELTITNVIEIVNNLYKLRLAEAWFIGMEWPEGYNYCSNGGYLKATAAPMLLNRHTRAVWFACRFLD